MLMQMQEFPGLCFNNLQSPALHSPPPCFTFPIAFVTPQYTVGVNYSFCLSSIFPVLKVNNTLTGDSLVGQWLRIRLPMQWTRVQALAPEDPTCHGAAGPVIHNY